MEACHLTSNAILHLGVVWWGWYLLEACRLTSIAILHLADNDLANRRVSCSPGERSAICITGSKSLVYNSTSMSDSVMCSFRRDHVISYGVPDSLFSCVPGMYYY